MENLVDIIKKHGVENCLFLVPMRPVRKAFFFSYTNSSDEEVLVPAKIVESRYKLKDNYKITLASLYESFGEESFYISDLKSLIKQGTVEFFTSQKITQ